MAVSRHGRIRQDVLDQGTDDPDVVRLNEVGLEILGHGGDVLAPGFPVTLQLAGCESRENAAGIRHHVAHAGQGKIRTVPLEHQGVNVLVRQVVHGGMGVRGHGSHDHALFPPGGRGETNGGLQGHATAGQGWALG
jgi:hypothetical protein